MKKVKDPGLGISYRKPVSRLMNPNGSYNIHRIGAVTGYKDFYKYLIDLSPLRFALVLTTFFVAINLLFTSLYVIIGTDQIHGIPEGQHPFLGALYFSAQTFTTVGYGALAPTGHAASILAAIEAFCGLIAFAIATGLLYGRFSKPSSRIGFTRNILLIPHQSGTAMMFKLVNKRNNVLLNTKISVLISINHRNAEDGTYSREYYNLGLEVDSVRYFPLTWTIVHMINDESPLNGLSIADLQEKDAEILVLLEAFDETFTQNVIHKHSYAAEQWLEGYRFKRNFYANDHGSIVLNIHELNELEPIN